jgi:N-acetylmuramic acid 6-phosphate etherase
MDGLAAAGFTGVLHTLSENDFAYYRATLGAMVARSQAAGLEVQVGPWGVGRTFGGEAETRFVAVHPEVGQVLDDGRPTTAGCPNHPEYRAFVRSWATAAVETGADRVFWDEPHWAHPAHFEAAPERWGCRCRQCRGRYREEMGEDMPTVLTPEVAKLREAWMVEFVGEMVAHVAGLGGRSTVCLLPLTEGFHGLADWSAVACLPGLDTLATDPYWQSFSQPVVPFVGGFARRLQTLAAEAGVGAQLWIQGFRLGPEDEEDIRAAVAEARAAGVGDLWTWGYEACGHMSYLGTRDPARVWAILTDALTGSTPDEPALEFHPMHGIATPERDDALVTEAHRADLADLDLRPTEEVVRLLVGDEAAVAAAVEGAVPAVAAVVDAVAARLAAGGRLFYAGAGTAGRLGVLDAAECGPTFGTTGEVQALLAGGEAALVIPREGAEDDRGAAAADLTACGLGPADAVVAISASGRTPYALGALDHARAVGALAVAVACNPGSPLVAGADLAVEVIVGPEVITGSTRLKAGTAQKLVLNAISTATMVRLGRTYGNLMVDVRGGSAKLADRAVRIVALATGRSREEAEAALAAAGGEVKTAIVALLAGLDPQAARARLAAAAGVVRRALETAP